MQTCPFCGQNYRVEMTKVEGPWAFFECAGCSELSVVRGKSGFELPKPPRRRPRITAPSPQASVQASVAARAPSPAPMSMAQATTRLSGSPLGDSVVPAPISFASTFPVMLEPTSATQEAPVSPTLLALRKRATEVVRAVARAARKPPRARFAAKTPGMARLRALAITSSSLALNLLCGLLVLAALILPFTFSSIRDALRGAQAANPIPATQIAAAQGETQPLQVEALPARATATIAVATATIKHDRAVLRSGPGPDFARVAVAERGSKVQILSRKDGWVEINQPNVPAGSAWIRADLLAENGAKP